MNDQEVLEDGMMFIHTKNGKELRPIDYMDSCHGNPIASQVPVLRDNEWASYSIDGECHVYEIR